MNTEYGTGISMKNKAYNEAAHNDANEISYTCPYPHCSELLKTNDLNYHEACGRRVNKCTRCKRNNTVFSRFCAQCGDEMPTFASWSEPLGNSLKNRSISKTFKTNVNFLDSWQKEIKSRLDKDSPEIICAGDLVMVHNENTRSLEGYTLFNSNPNDTEPLEKWQWNQATGRACKAMSPVKADYYAIFVDGTENDAHFVIINLLTLESERISMAPDSRLRRNSLPAIEKSNPENENEYVLCYTLEESLNFYTFSSIDRSIKLRKKINFSAVYRDIDFWNPVSLNGQFVHLTKTGAGIISRIQQNDITHLEFPQIDTAGTYFQPTVFVNHVYPMNRMNCNINLFIPFQDTDSNWYMLFSDFTEHWQPGLLVKKNLQNGIDRTTFSCSGLNTISGAVFFHGSTIFRISVHNNSLREPKDDVPEFHIVKPYNAIAGAKNLLIAYDDAGCLIALDLPKLEILSSKTVCSNSNPEELVSGPIFTDDFVILQNTREVICVKL